MTGPKDAVQVINKIVQKLVTEYSPQRVILFGSYAWGKPGPDSDIDFLIIKETSDRFIDRYVKVQHILTGTHSGYPVETLVLTPREIETRISVGDKFIGEILESGEPLYAT